MEAEAKILEGCKTVEQYEAKGDLELGVQGLLGSKKEQRVCQ